MTNLKRTDKQFIDEATVIQELTPREISYREGYVQGQQSEQYRQHQQYRKQKSLEDQNLSLGVVLGILLTASIGLGVGAFYVFNQQQKPIPVASPTASPEVNASPSSTTSPSSNKETTIIERTVEKAREVLPAASPSVELPTSAPTSPATPEASVDQQPQNVPTPQVNAAPTGEAATPEAITIPQSIGQ
jgi:cytoskeletal protein RodZ